MSAFNNVHDIIVVGAGLSGIAFTRFYLDVHQEADIVVVDNDTHLGGVWSSSRVFDGFWTQSCESMIGFSDVKFKIPENSPSYWQTCPAKNVTNYLESYADSHVYNGMPLRSRFRMQREVVEVVQDHLDGSSNHANRKVWRVTSKLPSGEFEILYSKKIVIGTGKSSTPKMPELKNEESFPGRILSQKGFRDFLQNEPNYSTTEGNIRDVVVLGGGKSAADMAYDAAKRGKNVTWIIKRKNGAGPALFLPAQPGTARYQSAVEKDTTRYSQLYAPSSFMPANSLLPRLMHGTSWGRSIVSKKHDAAREACLVAPQYRTREGAKAGFELLEPTGHPFWHTSPIGIVQHDDFWDVVATKVQVREGGVDCLTSKGEVVMTDGAHIAADAIFCGTGWRNDYPFLTRLLNQQFGLPHTSDEDSLHEAEMWDDLLDEADKAVLRRFPVLANPPTTEKPIINETPIVPVNSTAPLMVREDSQATMNSIDSKIDPKSITPTRLYNYMVPVDGPNGLAGDRSVAFLGHCDVSNAFRTAEAQAVWTTAYMDGRLAARGALPALPEARKQVAFMAAFSRRRYPSRGIKGNCIFSELVWYTDYLMNDVGVRSHQRSSGIGHWLDPCVATDLQDAVEEYKSTTVKPKAITASA